MPEDMLSDVSIAALIKALDGAAMRHRVLASNIANPETTRTARGGPYQRKQVVFQALPNTPGRDRLGHLGPRRALPAPPERPAGPSCRILATSAVPLNSTQFSLDSCPVRAIMLAW